MSNSPPNSINPIENINEQPLFRNHNLDLSSDDDDESESRFEDFLSKSRPKSPTIKSSPTVIIVDDSDTEDEIDVVVKSTEPNRCNDKSKSLTQQPNGRSLLDTPNLDSTGRSGNSNTIDEITQLLTCVDLTGDDSEVDSDCEISTHSIFTHQHLVQTPIKSHSSVPTDPLTPNPITPKANTSKRDKNLNSTSREVLANKWYFFFNETVFESLLPADMKISWNKNLTKTAGYCEYRHSSTCRLSTRTVCINLSTKILTDEERLKSTLIHELCHAATWIINGVKEGHGPTWRGWAEKAGRLVPGLPPITRCHSYSIDTKFKYKCVNCYYIVGRHSKSIDTSRQCCPLCRSRIELVPLTNKDGTPRKLNQFAEFVKDNYNSAEKTLTHSEKMKFLSKEYSKLK